MLPPKLGLMSYVADAYLEGRSDDILLQPVSISFDQLHETAEYAAYARGGEKTPEGVSWLYNFIKAQGERNYGKIYVRFPEAVSMREYLGEPGGPIGEDEAAKRLAMQKMAIEVSWRILRATPVNATGLVAALLLTTRGTALTLDQLHHTLQDSLDYLERKQTPVTNSVLRLRTADGVRSALDALSNGHPVTRVDGGREPVWRIAPEQEHEAAFYRNTIIDAFLETAIVELALAYAARADGDRLEAFWTQAMRLRDLLKFDFYFADSTAFREHLAEEMAWHDDWEAHVAAGGEEIDPTAAGQAAVDLAGRAAALYRGVRDRGRRVARRPRRDRREGTDEEGDGRRQPVRRAEPGAHHRGGVGAAVRDRATGGRRPASAGAGGGSGRAADRLPRRTARRAARHGQGRADLPRAVLRPRDGPTRSARRVRVAHRAGPYAWSMTTATQNVRTSAVWPVLLGVAALAGVTAAGLGAMTLADALTATGLPDPGPVTTYGLPFVRAAGEIAAVVAVGSFMFAAFMVPPQQNGVLDADGYRALRVGTVASAIWTVCSALLVPLTVSDVTGQPLTSRLSPSDIWAVAGLVETAGAWRWTAVLAAIVTVVSIPVLRWSPTPMLFAGSLVTLLPLALTGHSSSGGSHDLATNSLLIHLIAAALWAGGLLALLVHALARRRARRSGRAPILGCRAVVLHRDGDQRRRQRPGANPAR